jgi:hypothetical protein
MTKRIPRTKREGTGYFFERIIEKSLTKQAICAASLLTMFSKEAIVVKSAMPVRDTTRRTANEIPESKSAPSRSNTRPHRLQMFFLA